MTNKILQEGFKPSFFPFGKIATAFLLAFASVQTLHAQWLEWSDESTTRLVVSSVAVSDSEEKDMWAADLNNDGHEDIIVVRKEPFSNPTEPAKSDLLLMNVNGILTDMTATYAPGFISTPTYARDIFIKDFNADGWQDVIVANTFGMQPVFYQNQGEDINGNWLGLADETSTRLPDLTDDVTLICAVWGGDVSGDGAPDIYFANYKQGGTALDFLLINDGSGHFTNESQARLGDLRNSAFGTAVQIHDMDNDGDNDIIKVTTLYSVTPWNSLGTILLFNNGDGTFTNWQNLTPSAAPYMFDVADFNLDGNKDLYVVDDGSDRLLTVTGFTANTSLSITQTSVNFGSVNGFGGNVHAMDVDLDGDMDIAVSDVDVDIPPCDSGRRMAILRNDGGTFTNPYGTTLYPWADNSYDMVWIDINEDGLPDFVTGKCSGYGVFMSDNCGLAPNPSDYDEDGLADTCDPCPTNPDPNCAPPTDYPTTSLDFSAARQWNEMLLASIRRDFARPPVHARNLFHFSVAAYDSWAAYETSNCTFLLGQTVDGFSCAFSGIQAPQDIEAARAITISYACYRLLRNRFGNSPNAALLYQGYDAHMAALGLDINFTSADYSTGSAAALGNYIAECIIAFGLQDGSNQGGNYVNTSYTPINPPMIVDDPGNPNVVDINRWQPTTLDIFIDQSGNEIPGATPAFIGAQWGSVTPFSLKDEDKTVHPRNGWNYEVYHDPGTPPLHSMDGSGTTNLFQWNYETVAMWSSHLDATDGVMWDISPASRGNQNTLPSNLQDHTTFYDQQNGGTVGSTGHSINPVTGQPYAPNIVPRGDYSRVLAEFWADGPNSETPPGHWFSIFNYVADHPLVEKKFKGQGPVLNDLEWDVKGYLAMGGAMHDVAITSWGIKGHYDYTRPVHALRAMADLGQCSDALLPNYHPGGLHLIPGYIELIQPGDPLAGSGNVNVNKIKVKSWKGHDVINNVDTDEAGVGWILAEEWFPYQRSSFVTPPFAGYVSGHSSYSRAAAEVMTQFTGNEFFPGGMGEFFAPQNEFLIFEDGPSVDIHLQWATYRDAADESALSRIWGGIHPPADDIPARLLGITVGNEAFTKAEALFSDADDDGVCNLNDTPCEQNQEVCDGIDNNCNNLIDEGFDLDNDGYTTCEGDCNDNNAAVNPGASEICNAIDDNCNGSTDEGFDLDNDGYTNCAGDCDDNNANVNPGMVEISCNLIDDNCSGSIDEFDDLDGDTWTTCAGDCDDTNPLINPGMAGLDICDGIDNDCDNLFDEDHIPSNPCEVCQTGEVVTIGYWQYPDLDNDGYGVNTGAQFYCEPLTGFAINTGDCAPNNDAVYPGATEVCNNIDDDCDGNIDEGFDLDNDGYTTCEGDCDDNNATINPGAVEICNNTDDDCDGLTDEGIGQTWYVDNDGDGYGNSNTTTTSCNQPTGYAAQDGDCDDNNNAIKPGAVEICNTVDDDCDGLIDEELGQIWYADADNDGYGNINVTLTACLQPTGYTLLGGDCDDNNNAVKPGAIEVCNTIDDDCDGLIDEGLLTTYYLDTDGDGYGNDQLTLEACSLPTGYAFVGGDCFDNDAAINPGESEICGNGVDDNCDGIQTGDNVELICPTISLVQCSGLNNMEQPVLVGGCPTDEFLVEYIVDYDANGCAYNVTVSANAYRGEDNIATCEVMIPVSDIEAPVFNSFADIVVSLPSGESTVVVNYNPSAFDNCHDVTMVCIPPSGTAFGPGTTSVTCTAEDACGNFSILEFDVIVSSNAIWYQDNDGDGYGNPNVSIAAPTPPTGYVSDSTDCNDSAFAINPGAVEICNGIDDNCDEQIDEGYDTDGDGYTDCQGDCDDNNNAIYPGAAEICNNIDDDCDGLTDEGVGFTWYADEDNDGYGDNNTAFIACTQPTGYIAQGGDCNDDNSAINPAASEICFNGIDEDCDGTADDGCPAVANDWKQYAVSLNVGAYNTCNPTTGNMALATTSPESQSTATTGQDLWYSFIPISPGVQIKVNTTAFNALVELQNNAGVMIDSENIQAVNGNEFLNIGNLTPGVVYFIAVRNFNSAQGTGNFNICLSNLPASGCLTPAASYTMCSKFKAVVVNASNYVYNFTSTQTNITYSRTQPSATLDLYKVMNMPTGSNYVARVDASYSLTRGNGTSETVVVQGPSTCTFAFTADPLLILATTQDCPSPRPLGVNIRSNTTVCYPLNYQWEFQKADLSEPVFSFNGGNTQYLMITSAMGFVPGTTYNVRIRVTYQNGYTNPWGPWKCLLIAGGAGMADYFDDETGEYTFDRNDEEIDINLYPNPNAGNSINLEIAGIESGLLDMQLIDGMGKLIATRQIQVEGYVIANWVFDNELSAGLYFIQFTHENKRYAEKIIVE